MEINEILHELERATGRFARAAVEAAVARREDVTPELLRILEDTVDRASQLDAEGDYMAHLYAMFLLAQFRETRAYPLVVRFVDVGLREMAGVARFGEQAEVGQFEPRRQITFLNQSRNTLAVQPGSIGKGQQEQSTRQTKES